MRRCKNFGIGEDSPRGGKYHVESRLNGVPQVVPAVETISPDDIELPPGNNYRPCYNIYETTRIGEAVMTKVTPFEKVYKEKDFKWTEMISNGGVSVHDTLIPSANFEMDYSEKLPDLNIKIVNELEVIFIKEK